jgi:hypothetical protein
VTVTAAAAGDGAAAISGQAISGQAISVCGAHEMH